MYVYLCIHNMIYDTDHMYTKINPKLQTPIRNPEVQVNGLQAKTSDGSKAVDMAHVSSWLACSLFRAPSLSFSLALARAISLTPPCSLDRTSRLTNAVL